MGRGALVRLHQLSYKSFTSSHGHQLLAGHLLLPCSLVGDRLAMTSSSPCLRPPASAPPRLARLPGPA